MIPFSRTPARTTPRRRSRTRVSDLKQRLAVVVALPARQYLIRPSGDPEQPFRERTVRPTRVRESPDRSRARRRERLARARASARAHARSRRVSRRAHGQRRERVRGRRPRALRSPHEIRQERQRARSVPVVVIARARVTFGVSVVPTLDPRESESSSFITRVMTLSRAPRETLATLARARRLKIPHGDSRRSRARASSNARESRRRHHRSIPARVTTRHESRHGSTPARDAIHHSSTRASPSTSPPSSRARATDRTNEFHLACPSTRLARDSLARAGRPNASSRRGTNERLDRAVSTRATTTTRLVLERDSDGCER